MHRFWLGAAVAASLLTPAHASVIYAASGAAASRIVASKATFTLSGNELQIDLAATYASPGKYGPAAGLSGLFFSIAGDPALTPISATVAPGSSIIHAGTCTPGPCAGVTDVGGEWGYQYSAAGFTGGPAGNYGISSSGYLTTGLPHNVGNFNNGKAGANLDDPASLGGANFELFAKTVKSFTRGNGGLMNTPLIESEVNFVLGGVPSGFALSDISNVSFQYGTSFTETNLSDSCVSGCPAPSVPEPASWGAFAVAVLGLGLLYQARRRA